MYEWHRPSHTLDWSLVQAFLAVAETGSLSGGARSSAAASRRSGARCARSRRRWARSCSGATPRGSRSPRPGAPCCPRPRRCGKRPARMALIAAGEDRGLAGQRADHRLGGDVALRAAADPRRAAAARNPGSRSTWWRRIVARTCCSARPTSRCGCIARNSSTWSPGMSAICRSGSTRRRAYLDRAGRPATVEDLLGARLGRLRPQRDDDPRHAQMPAGR